MWLGDNSSREPAAEALPRVRQRGAAAVLAAAHPGTCRSPPPRLLGPPHPGEYPPASCQAST